MNKIWQIVLEENLKKSIEDFFAGITGKISEVISAQILNLEVFLDEYL